MKDIIYAGFAQLSYLNWHKSGIEINGEKIILENKKLKKIFEKEEYFELLKNGDYAKIYPEGQDYLREENIGNGVVAKIYDRRDARIFMLYSEDRTNPNETPKFPEFGEWEFLCGYDHKKIREEMGEESCVLKEKDSGFQASAFRKGNTILLAYRGSDDMSDKGNKESDWIETNLRLGFNIMPDALICTAWMYEKVKEISKGAEIHITGHSMGGALAQFATIYSEGKHRMVTWSALGIGEPSKRYQITNVSQNNEWLDFDFFEPILEEFRFIEEGKWQSKCEYISEIEIKKMLNEAVKRKKKIVDTRIENPEVYELSEDEINRLTKEIKHKQRVIYLYQKNYEKLSRSNDSQKYINYYYGEDLTPNLQEKEGPVKTVNNVTDKNSHDTGGTGLGRKLVAIVSSSFSEYHGLPMYFPFMNDEGNIAPGKLNKNYVLNGIKTIIRNEYQYEIEARQMMQSNSQPNGFPKKFDKSLEDYNRVTGNSIPNPKKELSEDLSILNRFSFGKNLIEAVKEYKNNWYSNNEESKSVECGVFNNCEEIGGVSGGVPLIVKICKNFKEVLDVILPPIKSKMYTVCDEKALEKHKISYEKGRILKNGSIEIKTGEKEYKNDYELYPENKFGAKSKEENGEFGIHLGVDFSYGRDNEITCSHPSVYSPINGVIESVKPHKVVIRQEKVEKVINGDSVEVYYYHEIEHLHTIDSKIEEGKYVCSGARLGEMGGAGDNDDLYRYYQHVHYAIRMEESYYTGYIDYNQPYSKDNIVKERSTKQRYLNPEKFWNERIEEGRIDFKFE